MAIWNCLNLAATYLSNSICSFYIPFQNGELVFDPHHHSPVHQTFNQRIIIYFIRKVLLCSWPPVLMVWIRPRCYVKIIKRFARLVESKTCTTGCQPYRYSSPNEVSEYYLIQLNVCNRYLKTLPYVANFIKHIWRQ